MKTYHKWIPAKSRVITREQVKTEFQVTDRITIDSHKYLDSRLKVPLYPAMCPETALMIARESYRLKNPCISVLYLFLLTQLTTKEQGNVVEIKQDELVKYLGVSKGTINKAFQVLVELRCIKKIVNAKYKVSPLVGWVGDHISWAEAILVEQKEINSIDRETYTVMESDSE